ncbi:MAG TPA: cytochrome b [Thiobacillus sp.]|nr:MAG: cytochrome b [Hydrogenophilales bacterium 28-61-11]OYZ57702.1 MAG: cytochrome b [Hydrogenophilales bacterium 16-61-112]OZA46763.1 MAG: cytochrome b [Hydrogenophilales bacterium 17-61-76]HQT70362.1 cytochrome b [Thiobacillus sp.]
MTLNTRYTTPAIVLHWLVALLVFVGFPLGVYMQDLPLSPTKLQLYSYHKWIGITVLLLAGLRVVWRLTHRPPPLPDSVVRWQRQVSAAVHGLLYLLILAIPLSGWLMSSAKGFPVVWFGVVPLPDLVGKDKALGDLLVGVHQALNFTLLGLVILHVAAALKHHFIERQPFLQRMGWNKQEQL